MINLWNVNDFRTVFTGYIYDISTSLSTLVYTYLKVILPCASDEPLELKQYVSLGIFNALKYAVNYNVQKSSCIAAVHYFIVDDGSNIMNNGLKNDIVLSILYL